MQCIDPLISDHTPHMLQLLEYVVVSFWGRNDRPGFREAEKRDIRPLGE